MAKEKNNAESGKTVNNATESYYAPLPLPGGEVDWTKRHENIRKDFVSEVRGRYQKRLEYFKSEADRCAIRTRKLARSHRIMRFVMILSTGMMAILNLSQNFPFVEKWRMPVICSLYAALLVVLTNLDSFFAYQTRALAYRDCREVYMTAVRQFDRMWLGSVHPLGHEPSACTHAEELLERIDERDEELRRKLQELQDPRSGQ